MTGLWDKLWERLAGDAPPQLGTGTDHEVVVAAAALLVEAARLDDRFDAAERATILRLLHERLGVPRDNVATLLAEAEGSVAQSSQLFGFVRMILQHCDAARREEIIEMLWEVVYADGHLDGEEDALLRRLAGLLYVSDKARGEARRRVLDRMLTAGQRPEAASETGVT